MLLVFLFEKLIQLLSLILESPETPRLILKLQKTSRYNLKLKFTEGL